ncbi:MAG TPA: hypothetical protein VF179_26955, partial [Thermoanaerobaculia bacterium]|nr:hypothetical protein [Thermoanaerobaculia bacterium]
MFLLLLAATPLLAQERCDPSLTIAECFQHHLSADSSYLKSMKTKERNDLQIQPTGVDTGGANVATNKKDFNPLMALAGLLGTSTDGTGEAEGTMLLNLNFPLPAFNPERVKNAQLQGLVNTQPQLSELIRNKIQGDGTILADDRDARISRLEEQISD